MTMVHEKTVLKNFIGGRWVDAEAAGTAPVYNPATGEVIAETPLSTAADVARAVEAAKAAYERWRKVPVIKRARLLYAYLERLRREREALARMITTEHGKSLADALAEVDRGIESVEHATAAPTLMMGDALAEVAEGLEQTTYRYPLGVVASITPFNFPAMIPLWVIPWAVVTGNALILKPSEQTPMTTLRLVELLHEVGLPDGVVNVVNGAKEAVDALLAHPDIVAVNFTGSQKTAAYVYETAARYGKRVQAFSGAKNHAVVLEDAVLAPTIDGILRAAFGNGGQRCMATSVVVAVEGIADDLVERLADGARKLKVGSGFEEGVELTPLIREEHRRRVLSYIEEGEKQARLVVDGREAMSRFPRGFYLGATVFDRVTPEMRLWQEEIFGPVLSVVRVRDLDEAIAVTNRSRYANGAILYTQSGKAARRFREEIDAGMVGINVNIPLPVAFFPFGGHKDSFYGVIGENGKDIVQFFTRKKTVSSRWF
ncbi:CoA-acylating methylmalonate-semialdehyde dehydrogenase [Hydrogenibacillus schlegelii]|uniref:methylmalonate-semialdehyde dehydrogenase (CoA acylating) n=1 Tax=Hydrogenibacillus schlegelii TaxID=1484 RepID=A0A179IRF7_HYDSH|nr:CoA-acylating methylmalonate-semialdehyde dehydrogenase [Hydrogenibacillus schlegelii]OAR04905.1 methylmalonate-semialdehyde dehydrogenase [Hydrogenibacillus schlegelii]